MTMTDDLVTRLMETDASAKPAYAEAYMAEAARAIEALTAERDEALAMQNVAYAAGYYQAECGLREHESAVAALAELKALTADNARLKTILSEMGYIDE
jgi:hypothetical protein